jgi:hypothetical protein
MAGKEDLFFVSEVRSISTTSSNIYFTMIGRHNDTMREGAYRKHYYLPRYDE